MAGIRLLLPTSLKHPFHRLGAGIRTLNPAGVATAILLVGSAVALALLWRYWDVFARSVGAPARPESSFYVDEDSRTCQSSDTSVLRRVFRWHKLALGLVIWRLFPKLEESQKDAPTLRVMKWATLGLAVLIVAVAVAPRRAIWDSFAVATFDNHTALVIGTTREELLLYAPNEPGRPRFRIRKDAPGLRLTGETRALFDRRPTS